MCGAWAIPARPNEISRLSADIPIDPSTGLVKRGVTKDQLMAQLKTDDLGWQFNFTGNQLDSFYAELTK